MDIADKPHGVLLGHRQESLLSLIFPTPVRHEQSRAFVSATMAIQGKAAENNPKARGKLLRVTRLEVFSFKIITSTLIASYAETGDFLPRS